MAILDSDIRITRLLERVLESGGVLMRIIESTCDKCEIGACAGCYTQSSLLDHANLMGEVGVELGLRHEVEDGDVG